MSQAMNDFPKNLSQSRDLLRVLEVSRQLALSTDLPQLLNQVIDAGRKVLDADRGSVFLYDQPTHELYIISGTGLEALRFSADQGLAGQCATTRQVLNIPDCYADDRFNQEIDRRTGYRTRCMITVPLIGLEDRLVGVMQLLNARKGVFDAEDEPIALALAGQAAVAIQRARLLAEQKVKLRLERDLALARQMQQAVLPDTLPAIPGYDLAVFNQPADETGGDIYDVVSLEQPSDADTDSSEIAEVVTQSPDPVPVMVMLADATGHGIGPALSVTQMRAMFRMGLRQGVSLTRLVKDIDTQLHEDLGGKRFITAFFGKLDPVTHQVHYDAPGQAPLLCYHAKTDQFETRDASGLPLGIMPSMEGEKTVPFVLAPGDMLILLTDGFYERQRADDKQQFGNDNVQCVVRQHKHQSAEQIIRALVQALDDFAPGVPQADDWTAIIIKRQASDA